MSPLLRVTINTSEVDASGWAARCGFDVANVHDYGDGTAIVDIAPTADADERWIDDALNDDDAVISWADAPAGAR